jgi:hypothetical protein
MPDWSIKIVPENAKPTGFVPDLRGAKPGDPLTAEVGDIVTWNNTTSEACWPWPTDSTGRPLSDDKVSTATGNYLSDQIPVGSSSTPYFNPIQALAGTTLTYCCKLHPQVAGSIVITAIPTT